MKTQLQRRNQDNGDARTVRRLPKRTAGREWNYPTRESVRAADGRPAEAKLTKPFGAQRLHERVPDVVHLATGFYAQDLGFASI